MRNILNCWRFGGEPTWGYGPYAGINNIDCHLSLAHTDYGIATYTRDAITIRGDSIGTTAYSCTGTTFEYRIYGGINGEYGYYGLDFIKAFATSKKTI